MKNNKGFTLVELLVVIIILISVSAIALPNVLTTLEKNKEQEIKNQYELLISYIEIYDSKNNNYIANRTNGCYVNVSQIVSFLNVDNSKFEKISNGKITYSNYTYVYDSGDTLGSCTLE